MATPEEILKEAALTVSNRGTDNGYDAGQERSAGRVAAIYNVLKDAELTEKDIWLIQIILKLVRNARKERNDNILDLAGYVSLLGESQWICAGKKPDNELVPALDIPNEAKSAKHIYVVNSAGGGYLIHISGFRFQGSAVFARYEANRESPYIALKKGVRLTLEYAKGNIRHLEVL